MANKVVHWVEDGVTQELLTRLVSTIVIISHACLGIVVVADRTLFQQEEYYPLRDIVSGHILVWAVWILASAFLMLSPFRWLSITGLWLGVLWTATWTASCALAASRPDSDGGSVAMILYGTLSAIDAALLTARVLDRGR